MKGFLEYISQYDLSVVSEFKGASEEKIQKLEEIAGVDLPKDYYNFLKSLGAKNLPNFLIGRNWEDSESTSIELQHLVKISDGKFKDVYEFEDKISEYFGKTETIIDEIIDNYQECEDYGIEPPFHSDEKIEIANCWRTEDIVMDWNSQIVEMYGISSSEVFIKLSDNIENLLCSNTFSHFELENRRFKNYYRTKKEVKPLEIMKDISITAKQLNLSDQWFSDSVRLHFISNDNEVVMAYYSNVEGVKLAIAADEESRFNELKSTFLPKYQLIEFDDIEKWLIRKFSEIAYHYIQ